MVSKVNWSFVTKTVENADLFDGKMELAEKIAHHM